MRSAERIKAKRAKQRLLVLPASAGTGVAVGIVAGASGTPWPDLLLTAFVVVFEMVFPLMLVLRAKRLVALSTRTLQLDGSATRVRGEHDDEQRRDGPKQKRNQEPEETASPLTLREARVDQGQRAPTDGVIMDDHASRLRNYRTSSGGGHGSPHAACRASL